MKPMRSWATIFGSWSKNGWAMIRNGMHAQVAPAFHGGRGGTDAATSTTGTESGGCARPGWNPGATADGPTVSTENRVVPRKRDINPIIALLICLGLAWLIPASAQADEVVARPNILWLTAEDIGPELGCYGDAYARTPHIDGLAARSLRYDRAWSNAPVCAPARTTILAGMHATSLGAQHMRSHVHYPDFIEFFPQLLRKAGYYCTNNVKEDYNVIPNGQLWDDSSRNAHWKNRAEGQPFFAVVNHTSTHESQIRTRPHELVSDPENAPVPPYHPDTPEVRHDWAQYYDNIATLDDQIGAILAELEADGLSESTIVFFYGDHGSGMPRHKRWLYNAGLRVPMIVHIPEAFRHLAPEDYLPGGVSERLVSFVDLAATTLSLADIRIPAQYEGHAWMGPHADEAPQYLYGYRDRMDERIDMSRAVTDGRYLYIRNYMPHRIQGQHLAYMWQTPTTPVWEALYQSGNATPAQQSFWEPKPAEELYDSKNDPHEINNLADDPAHAETRDRLRLALREHLIKSRDTGFLPEAEMHRRKNELVVFFPIEGNRSGALEINRDAPSTIYMWSTSLFKYPVAEIIDAAERAASRDMGQLDALRADAQAEEAAIRYWAMIGVLVRGQEAFDALASEVRQALDESNPSVRIAAAEAAGRYGAAEDIEKALETLAELASPATSSAYAAIAALNAIDHLGEKAASLHASLQHIPDEDPNAPKRANEYVHRLKKYLAP